ncbi:MAG TPA: PEGA domain-containing protein [Pyrinomonadaceae bacterium]|nr:PEGA domain-containing protein [Pyrinomonadaceae bacterium]
MSRLKVMINAAPAAARRKSLMLACCLVVCAASLSGTSVYAQRNRLPQNGRIEVSTTPGGYPIIVDGRGVGTTSPTVQLYELEPGRHTVEIQFPNNTRWVRDFDIASNKKQCITLNYRPKTISIERPIIAKSPCPYPVNISAPASVREGDIITFSSDVSYAGQSGLIYTWTISPPSARIMSGAGTPTITVDTTGVGQQRVTAILVVDDGSGDRMCRQRAQAATGVSPVEKPPVLAKSFAEFPSVAFNEDKANLDNFAIALQGEPGSRGYIIVYGGRRSRPGRANQLGERSRQYLVNTRNIDPNRIVIVNGGTRETDSFELWLVPQGATPPQASPR